MVDNTGKYAGMIEAFECDFSLARNNGKEYGLEKLQQKINKNDKRMLADIELLYRLSYGIRQGKIKIMEEA